jgi:hypothetical protein
VDSIHGSGMLFLIVCCTTCISNCLL